MIVSFAIGNSDDKLTQVEWSAFVGDVQRLVDQAAAHPGSVVHFAGLSRPDARWQNAVWALEPADESVRRALRSRLADIAGRYGQTPIAWWEAEETEMIGPSVAGP